MAHRGHARGVRVERRHVAVVRGSKLWWGGGRMATWWCGGKAAHDGWWRMAAWWCGGKQRAGRGSDLVTGGVAAVRQVQHEVSGGYLAAKSSMGNKTFPKPAGS